jgi:hypothetical protein
MNSFKSYLTAGIGFAMMVTIIFLATGWGSAVAAQISSVFVTNDASHPVPVAQQGTANVNVTNSTVPVHEQGTATVQQAGTPVHFELRERQTFGGNTYTVPAGKRLVIQYINGTVRDPVNGTPANALLFLDATTSTNTAEYEFVASNHASDDNSDHVSEAVTIYADPGSEVLLTTSEEFDLPATLEVDGYLTNA